MIAVHGAFGPRGGEMLLTSPQQHPMMITGQPSGGPRLSVVEWGLPRLSQTERRRMGLHLGAIGAGLSHCQRKEA